MARTTSSYRTRPSGSAPRPRDLGPRRRGGFRVRVGFRTLAYNTLVYLNHIQPWLLRHEVARRLERAVGLLRQLVAQGVARRLRVAQEHVDRASMAHSGVDPTSTPSPRSPRVGGVIILELPQARAELDGREAAHADRYEELAEPLRPLLTARGDVFDARWLAQQSPAPRPRTAREWPCT